MSAIAIIFMAIGFGITLGGLAVTFIIDAKHKKN